VTGPVKWSYYTDRSISRDVPACVDCGGEADMFTGGHWICDGCDDVRDLGRAA
jgi:hypothetical protein